MYDVKNYVVDKREKQCCGCGSISGDYGSEVVLTLRISFSLVNVLQSYKSHKLFLVYIPKCKKKLKY